MKKLMIYAMSGWIMLAMTKGAVGDLTMLIETKRPKGGPLESTLYASQGAWRLENAEAAFLHKPRQEGYFILYHQTKEYAKVSAQLEVVSDHFDELLWDKTGRTERIAGIPCEQLIGRKKGAKVAEVWFGGGKNFFEDLDGATDGLGGPVELFFPNVAGRFKIVDGYIMKYVEHLPPGRSTIVKKVDRANVDSKWFQLPNDYALINQPKAIMPLSKRDGGLEVPPLLPVQKAD